MGQKQQQQQSRSQSVSKRGVEGKGGCGTRRRRRKEVGVRHMESLVKGPPQRECVYACGSVVNRGGGEKQDTIEGH